MSVTKMKLRKGDSVIVIAGKHKGKIGTIAAVHPTENAITIEGVNVVKRAIKPSQTNPQGGIIELTKPLPASNVSALEPTSKKPSKISYKLNKDGSKTRIYKSSGKEISPPKLSGGKK